MNRRLRTIILGGIAGLMLLALVALIPARQVLRDPAPPSDLMEQLRWITRHPADWKVVSQVSDGALDSDLVRRRELWVSAFDHATHLAPRREHPAIGFVRAGLFHWYELNQTERRKVLEAVAPLMTDGRFFDEMYLPIWQLTRDFQFLRRVAPDTMPARLKLRDVAIRYGRFPEYRAMREELRAERLQVLAGISREAPVDSLLVLIPENLDTADAPLVKKILEELERRPFNPEQIGIQLEPLINFAIRNELQPMSGLRPMIEAPGKLNDVVRARAALHMGDVPLATRIEISTAVVGTAEWIPYYLDRALFAAGEGNAAEATNYLRRAQLANSSRQRVAAASEAVSRLLGESALADAQRARLIRDRAGALEWTGTCGERELCTSAVSWIYVAGTGDEASIEAATIQSDETAPYVELYIDDTLDAEGEIVESRKFAIRHREPGLHRVELRLVNRLTRGGIQRRLRLS